jgi:Sulfatase
MILTLILLAVIVVILLAERSAEHLPFAIATLFLSAATISIIVGDFERAMLLAGVLAAAITAASTVKHDYSALKLTVTDVPLMFAGTATFFASQYPRAVLAVLTGTAAFILAAIAVLIHGTGPSIALDVRLFLFSVTLVCVALAFRLSGGGMAFQQIIAQRRCFYSTFMASLIDPHSWRRAGVLAPSDIANDPLPLMAAVPARATDYPDIIVIQHESIFDPRIWGLPIEPTVEAFLSPANGLHGILNVDIFGGGSWQSEFSLLTGLSSASFGSNAYHLFKQGAGRFHNSLPHALAALGYKTMLASSCRRNFLSYDEFYRSIGIAERIFADDFPPPFDLREFEKTNSDAAFLDAAFAAHAKAIADDPAPRFLYALTNFNHGPHTRSLAAPGQFERQRAFAASTLPDPQYAEYYARLAETAATWKRHKLALAANFPERPMLVVHYGDHQPVMAKRIDRHLKLPNDAKRAFRTFYAMEALNIWPDRLVSGRGADLDIAFLGTVALQQAGLPLDPIFATRASLLEHCRETYFASPSERKRRFHRTLVDLGLIDIGPGVRRGHYLPTPTK